MGIKRWIVPCPQQEQLDTLARETGYPPALCAVLLNRGYTGKEAVEAAFGGEGTLHNPYSIMDMDKAVERLRAALDSGERIAVYGDYDCDGITATALLTNYLQSVGADVFYYIPDREKEGYGLNREAVDVLAGQKASLIVTVDNGISAHEEIAYAASLGMDTIITDHHTPRATLPQAVAVVNPHRADCPSAFKELAGVGVAFKLICAMEGDDGGELLEYYSDIVMLGTVADVVSLTGENRMIVSHGLRHLEETERPGLRALLDICGLSGKKLTSDSAAFGMIPRINAAGRMSCVDDAVELLLTDDVTYAQELAEKINGLNEQRKEIETGIIAEIQGMLTRNPQILTQQILLLSGHGWPHGVVGIVAAKIVERYGKPTILFSIENGEARGSGRSVEGFSLINAITACSEPLTQYGGHTLAAGLTLPEDKLEAFREMMIAYAEEQLAAMPVPTLPVDGLLGARQLTPEVMGAFSLLEPFGAGNRPPQFLLSGLTIDGIYPTSDKKHIRIRLTADKTSFYAVYFRMSGEQFPYRAGDVVDLVANVGVGEYNGKAQVSVKVRDLRLSGIPQEEILTQRERYIRHLRGRYGEGDRETLVPGREDFACIYKYLRKSGGFGHGFVELYYRLLPVSMGYDRMRVALDIMEEMGLVFRKDGGEQAALALCPVTGKVDMEASEILRELKGVEVAG